MSVMVGAIIVGGYERDENKYLSVTVTNRGSAPTTITHMVLYDYPSNLARRVPGWLNRRVKLFHPQTYIINRIGSPGPISCPICANNGHKITASFDPRGAWGPPGRRLVLQLDALSFLG
jgi:hypothetical protein